MAQGNIPPAFGFSKEFKPAKDARHSINAGERRTYRSRGQHEVRSVKAPSSLATHRRTAEKKAFWLPLPATVCFSSSFGTLNLRDQCGSSDNRLNLSIPKYTLFHKLQKSTDFQREDSVKAKKSNSEYLVELQPSIQSSRSEPYVARVCPAPDSKESPVKLNKEEIARLFVKITPNFVSPLSGIDHGRSVKLTEVWVTRCSLSLYDIVLFIMA